MENHLLTLPILIVLCLATFRVTRFILFDSFLDEPRDAFYAKIAHREDYFSRKLFELTTCSWCFGFWVALLAYSLYIWSNPTDFDQYDGINVFAVAGLAGLLHAFEPDPED